tara:strand:- start:1475 stop:2644 length:1170 start_codon:yes stop_codon:yes gene_type:complete
MKIVFLGNYPIMNFKQYISLKHDINVSAYWNYNLVSTLSKKNDVEIYVLSAFHGLKKDAIFKHENVNHHFIKISKVKNLFTGYMHTHRKLLKAISNIKPDIVAGVGTEHIYAYTAVKSGYPHVVTIHGIMRNVIKKEKKIITRHKYFYLLEKYVLKNSKNIISINPFVNKNLGNLIKGKIFNVENCIPESFFDYSLEKKQSTNILKLVFVGTIEPRKGVLDLLLACVKLKDSNIDFSLDIIGSVPSNYSDYFNKMKEIVNQKLNKSNIKFHGHLPQNEIANLVFNSSALILPSFEETAPMVISEAMALGTIVISTKVAGIPWMIDDKVTGLLFTPGNYEELFSKIFFILEAGEENIRMSKKARLKSEKLYHPNMVADKTYGVYKEIIGK